MSPIEEFSRAVIRGAQSPGPASSIPELSQAMTSQFRLGGVSQAGKAMGGVASQLADEEEKRREAERQRKIQELQDQLDPSKYQQLRKDDGGFQFLDPTGKEIDIDTFAKRTGQRRVDVLKESENPIDQQYIHDWSTLNDVTQALYTNDQQTIQMLKQQYPELFSGPVTPQNMAERLMKHYPHIYGRGSYQDTLRNLNQPLFRFSTDNPLTFGGAGGGGGGFQL